MTYLKLNLMPDVCWRRLDRANDQPMHLFFGTYVLFIYPQLHLFFKRDAIDIDICETGQPTGNNTEYTKYILRVSFVSVLFSCFGGI